MEELNSHSLIDTIAKFIEQGKTNDISTKNYIKIYENCEVKISFGKGRVSEVPWIAFLKGNNEVRKGIYPALLYYKRYNLLITTFAIGSFFNDGTSNWKFHPNHQYKTIEEVIDKKSNTKLNYGNSYVHMLFEIKDNLDLHTIKDSIDAMIKIYVEYN